MNYFRYLLKIGLKHKLNIVPAILVLGITMFLLTVNSTPVDRSQYIKDAELTLRLLRDQAAKAEEYLKETSLSDEEITFWTSHRVKLHQDIEKQQMSIDLALKGKWSESLKLNLEFIEENLMYHASNTETNDSLDSNTYNQYLYNQKAIYEILITENIEPEAPVMEQKGATFTYRIMDVIFPAIFTFCLIAFLSNLLSNSLIDRMDIEDMFSVNQVSWQVKKVLMSFCIGVSLYVIWLIITFSAASLVNGMGSFKYPIILHTETFTDTSPVISIMVQALILQILAILFIVLVVYLIALLSKNQLTTLFVPTVILACSTLLTTSFDPLNSVFHLFPTTYFNATRVVTHRLAVQLSNPHITLTNGIFVLLAFSTVVMLSIVLLKKRHEEGQLFSRV